MVFVGEQHDDPATHRVQLALLEALHASPEKRIVLSLEMFEQDVQAVLDDYLQGRISEEVFLARSRPWPNYRTDYRPLIAYAKANGIPVIAANVPRRLAARVAKEGEGVLASLAPEDRRWVPERLECPAGRLWERFNETMRDHPRVGEAGLRRMYHAQCLKDAAMAEAIARALPPDAVSPLLIHINGAFHSDEGLGVPAHLARIRPDLSQAVVTIRPVQSPSEATPSASADLVFYVSRKEP